MASSLWRQKCHHISLDEIKDATDNFDEKNVLGHGGEGKVYLAKIRLGCKMAQVAVKHLKPNSKEGFEKEIKTVSKIQHPNLVSLLGYCDESGQNILVYEYMEKGNLSSYVKEKNSISLSWKQRLRICLGAARGLLHLHAETDEFPKGIIHRDVKPENILLDKNWVAKISDFGMFKLSHFGQIQSTICTNLKGTGGYYAPEYVTYRNITRKIDVYAFGVVLFQVLCLKMPWDRGDESYYCTDDEDLGIWALENVDTRIKEEICSDSLKAVTTIIGKSLKKDPRKRPTMDKVVLDLENALKCQEHEDEAKQLQADTESDQKSTMEKIMLWFRPNLSICGPSEGRENSSICGSRESRENLPIRKSKESRVNLSLYQPNASREKLLVDFNQLSEEARDRARKNWRTVRSFVFMRGLIFSSHKNTDFNQLSEEARDRARKNWRTVRSFVFTRRIIFSSHKNTDFNQLSEEARDRARQNWRTVRSFVFTRRIIFSSHKNTDFNQLSEEARDRARKIWHGQIFRFHETHYISKP